MDITWNNKLHQRLHRVALWISDNTCYLFSLVVPSIELLRFGLPLNHRIHCLQVGGVGHEWQRDVPVRLSVDPLVVHAQVVLDIARTLQVQKRLWSEASLVFFIFSNCFPQRHTSVGASPRRQLPAWGRTDRRSDPGPSGSRWLRRWVDPWGEAVHRVHVKCGCTRRSTGEVRKHRVNSTYEACPWSRCQCLRRWTCLWWSWERGWAPRSPPDQNVSLMTTFWPGSPQTWT